MKHVTRFLLCLSLFGYATIIQAQRVNKSNIGNDYKTLDESLLQSKMRIAKIDSTLKKNKEDRLFGLIPVIGILGWTSYDLVTNNQNISKSRKTWNWVGLTISTGALMGFIIELKEGKALKKERKILEVKCLQIDSLKKIEIINWEMAKSVNTLMSYQKYLDQYPTGRFINEAKAGMEVPLWVKNSFLNTVASYKEYLTLYPSGRHVEEAKDKMEAIVWQNACNVNTLQAYQSYLKQFQNGHYKKTAQEIIEPGIWNKDNAENDYKLISTKYSPKYSSNAITINTYATSTKPSQSSRTVFSIDIVFNFVRPVNTLRGVVEILLSVAIKVPAYISIDITNGVLEKASIKGKPIIAENFYKLDVTGITSANVTVSYSGDKLPSEQYKTKFNDRNGLLGDLMFCVSQSGDLSFKISNLKVSELVNAILPDYMLPFKEQKSTKENKITPLSNLMKPTSIQEMNGHKITTIGYFIGEPSWDNQDILKKYNQKDFYFIEITTSIQVIIPYYSSDQIQLQWDKPPVLVIIPYGKIDNLKFGIDLTNSYYYLITGSLITLDEQFTNLLQVSPLAIVVESIEKKNK